MNRICKQLLAILLACLMLTALTLPAAADVIYEPEDSFYKTHSDDCVYNSYRRYLTNSAEGYVYLYQNPESKLTVRSYTNGETVSISYLYTSPTGEVWGILGDDSGWFRMSDLSLIYDSQAFLEDNKDKCTPYDDSFAAMEGSEGQPVIAWAYPGGTPESFTIRSGNVTDHVQMTYTDGGGLIWGHITYMYGMRDFWVCLSDPYSETVGNYAVTDHEIALKHEPVAESEIPVNENNVSAIVMAGVLIVIVVIATALLMRVMFLKKGGK